MTDTEKYFKERMALLGITDDMLQIELHYNSHQNAKFHKTKNPLKPYQIFVPNEKGIGILLYTIEQEVHWFRTEGGQKTKEYRQTRLLQPRLKKDNSIQKYEIPRGQKVLPFFHPLLLKKYKENIDIDILYLTEGHFKAFKACMHGIDCVGVPSITCLKNEEGLLHHDIIKLIKKCKVQKLVWLMDGDCRDITSKEITANIDLTTRPYIFYKSIESFFDLMSKEGVRIYFAHINSEELKGHPKGLDDLLCGLDNGSIEKVTKELNDYSIQKANFYNGAYITRFEITRSTNAVFKYFLLSDVDEFYRHHSLLRTELVQTPFLFFGTTYQFDAETSKCKMLIPKGASNYFRVGDSYYQYVAIPDQWDNIMHSFERREKKTIQDDNDKNIFKHIPKFVSFCNVPSHTDFQQIKHNCYNLYHPFEWEANDEIDCTNTIKFIKHIFGSEQLLLDPNDPESVVERWELGMDYLQLLYQKPQQILPILCLISVQRQTGKTTFGDWLKEIYKENMAIVGNADLKNDFNSHWISKLLVMVDETKIDNDVVLDKLKSLSTAKSAVLNSKGKDQKSIHIFTKYILNSNKEDDFIKIDKEEIRFWVIKVPRLSDIDRDINLLQKMTKEIPGFIHHLNTRKIKAAAKERHWFDSRLLITNALRGVVAQSKITLEKQLEIAFTELFDVSGEEEITMQLTDIAELVKMHNKKSYVRDVLQNKMGFLPSELPTTKYFPRIVEKRTGSGEISIECEYVKFKGRYYTFLKQNFKEA